MREPDRLARAVHLRTRGKVEHAPCSSVFRLVQCGSGIFGAVVATAVTVVTSAWAQPRPNPILVIEGDAPSCVSTEALRERVAEYISATAAQVSDVRVKLRARDGGRGVEFQMFQRGRLVARREFTSLPVRCSDRRDALAVSLALALEQPELTSTPPSQSADDASVGASAPATAIAPALSGAHDSAATASEPATLSAPPARSMFDNAARATNAPSGTTSDAATSGQQPAKPRTPSPAATSRAASAQQPANLRAPSPSHAAARSAHAAAARPEVVRLPVPIPERPPPSAAKAATAPSDVAPEVAGSDEGAGRGAMQWALHGGARWLVEALPSPVLAGQAGLALDVDRNFGLELSGLFSAEARTRFASASAHTQLIGGEGLSCLAARLAGVRADGCLGGIAAMYRAHGDGYHEDLDSTLFWAALVTRAALRWPEAGALALRLVVQGHWNLSRPALRVAGSGTDLRSRMFGGAVGVDVILPLAFLEGT